MDRVLVLSILLCALIIGYLNVFPDNLHEHNHINISYGSVFDMQNASAVSGRIVTSMDMRQIPSIYVQSTGHPSRMTPFFRDMHQSAFQNRRQQFANRPQFAADMHERAVFNRLLERNNMISYGDYFQMYVTPDNETVLEYLEENDLYDKYEIYKMALTWVWISDSLLNGQEEAWLYPAVFLSETPSFSSNPVAGSIVSDCEEQANTLASLLIASGEYNESTVRVAIGYVNFVEGAGAHAWVEVYEDGKWFPLDSTMGLYYDESKEQVVEADDSTDYYRFTAESYPVMQLWYYYNNKYFIDMVSKTGNAPDNWRTLPSSYI
ncbi:MAG: transglutaminase domain-containing protein [Methanomethylovorans sp.]|jgi:hypothetical protein|nr:transglutaminase domain-containing protein [Methanomethylovorans sp.]